MNLCLRSSFPSRLKLVVIVPCVNEHELSFSNALAMLNALAILTVFPTSLIMKY